MLTPAPSNAYMEMIKTKLDALNKVSGKSGHNHREDYTRADYGLDPRRDDHFDMMGRAAMDYMRQREQNNGHPPF